MTTIRREGAWQAKVTDAGRFYLEHGRHPDRPPPSSVAEASAKPDPGRDFAAELIAELRANDGTIRIDEPDDKTRADYRKAINAAKRRSLVPDGKQLLHTGRDIGPLIIKLADEGPEAATDWNRIRLRVRDEIAGEALFELLVREQPFLKVSEDIRGRAIALVRSLERKAERRGHTVATSRKSRQLYLRVREHSFSLKIVEEVDEVPRRLSADDPRVRRAYEWQRIKPPEYDSVPSRRLRLELSAGAPDARVWADQGRSKVEAKLVEVIDEAERQADQADEAARERRLQHERWLVAQEGLKLEREREEAATQAKWKSAMEAARGRAIEELRQKAFEDALIGWSIAGQIRDFCAALERSSAAAGMAGAATEWVEWALSRADQLDPTLRLRDFAAQFHPEPEADDLRPHLGEWSPFSARKEYRPPSKEPVNRQAASSYASGTPTWILARQGRFPWWRR
ncbi:hypothetical protein [Nonomuraea indica]|uniref:Uncharacterized protein n=1 Tax=Nonomuraea indica TaxID=1581193 RepID=A0ABW7ZVY4_9ACTN